MKYWIVALLVVFPLVVQANGIDEFVGQVLKEKNLEASEVCSDAVFLRRTYLSLTGKIPSAEKTKAFLADKSSVKRERLIDELLESKAFVESRVLKWGDLLRVKSEFPSNLWPNAVQAYQRWLTEQMMNNVPYDQFVRKLLLSSGSNFRQPSTNFYRAFQERTPQTISNNVALLFLGERDGLPGTEVFFSQVKYKNTNEWKEEIVYVDVDTESDVALVKMPDGKELNPVDERDYRKVYVDWLTSSENKVFAEVIANRVWFWLMRRGIVHEPDNFSVQNPPSNPALLRYLADELVRHHYDLKHLCRIILNSKAYQRSSATNKSNEKDQQYFSHYPVERITAEQLIDGIGDITGIRDAYMSKTPEPYSYYPCDMEAMQLADGSVTSSQLELFGRPSRDLSYENDRNNELNSKQILFLLNSSSLMEKIEKSEKLSLLFNGAETLNEIAKRAYLTVLNRFPTQQEIKKVQEISVGDKDLRESADRLVWALINTKEFLFIW